MRLAMPAGREQPQRDPELKRKAWLAVFLVSGLFWLVVALVAWHYWS
ncbi:YmiA family putative membrane protein [Enterobacteriaceae bacterium H11S18]|nr:MULTISPECIES: YmiA family putative membrane protein [Enterobacteriaceae]MCT4706320.1 YmiA family putative membrane protein [Dryocola clanedunensis]MCT4713070.1 YmiA family putative membrane protein [Dryocola clanedunensis]